METHKKRSLYHHSRPFLFLSSVVLLSSVSLLIFPSLKNMQKAHAASSVTPIPLISRNVPAYTNDNCNGSYPASLANDNSYDSNWKGCNTPSTANPTWISYDLSSVPQAQRGKVLVVWYNETGNYDHTVINENAYDIPQDYSIDVNNAPGGGTPPTTGWVTEVTVTGNHLHSRQTIFDMTGNNWVRINVTAPDGGPQNYGPSFNMDVYNASQGTDDDWIFYGGSIFAESMSHWTTGGVQSFQQLINAQSPTNFPVEEDGGISTLTSGEGLSYLPQWLSMFPGKYVGLGYGTNDALNCANPTSFYNNYVTMVQDILNAGKIPLVQTIVWGPNTNLQNCAPRLNAEIEQLYQNFPQVIPGPDAWTFFMKNPSLIGGDGIHPNAQGDGALRQLWANTALTSVYQVIAPTPTPSTTPSPSPTLTPTVTPTPTLTPSPTPTSTQTPTPTPTVGITYQATVLSDHPVAYFRLGEPNGTTAADSSGNKNNGTYLGTVAYGQPSLIYSDSSDTAIGFNGTNTAVAANGAAFDFTNSMTVEAWIHPTSLPTPGNYASVITKNGGPYSLLLSGSQVLFMTSSGGSWRFCTSPTGSITAGQTYYLVGTYNESAENFYINGQQVCSIAATGTIDTASSALVIGSWDTTVLFFNGTIDEVAVYNSVLSPDRIQAHYQAAL
jgi:lysophospholipase L1-like esterase